MSLFECLYPICRIITFLLGPAGDDAGATVWRRITVTVNTPRYSWLMGEDEEGTLASLRATHQELADPKLGEHRGASSRPPATDDSSSSSRCAVDVSGAGVRHWNRLEALANVLRALGKTGRPSLDRLTEETRWDACTNARVGANLLLARTFKARFLCRVQVSKPGMC